MTTKGSLPGRENCQECHAPILGWTGGLFDVFEERKRQDAKWGQQDHAPAFWMLILGEEFGEAQKAALEASWMKDRSWDDYRQELVQVAAVALAAIESLDRNGPPEREDHAKALGVRPPV